MTDSHLPKRRWFQFSLRAILALTVVFAVLLAAVERWREHVKNKAVYQSLKQDGVWVEFPDTPLDVALEFVADEFDIKIEVHDSIDRAAGVKLSDTDGRAILDATVGAVDATYEVRSCVVYVVPRPKDQDHANNEA